jgi:hypothetical protein
VRDREPERSREEGGHGEQVGERADHGRLGGSVDIPPNAVVVETKGRRVAQRGEPEQADGECAHAV